MNRNRISVIAVGWFLASCAATPSLPPEALLKQLEQRGTQALTEGDFRQARAQWQRGHALAQQYGDNAGIARFLVHLADADENVGEYRRAIERAQQALNIARDIRNRTIESRALLILSVAHRRMDDYAAAASYADTALTLARHLDDARLQSASLRNLGAVAQAQGAYQTALHYYRRALDLAEDAEDYSEQATTLNNLGGLYRRLAQYDQSLKHYERSLSLREKLRDRPGQGRVLGNLCVVRQHLRDFTRALEYCRRALDLAKDLGDRAREANHLNAIAAIHHAEGDYEQALVHYRRSAVLKRDLGDRAGEARSLNNMGDLYRQTNRPAQALEKFSESLSIKQRIEDSSGQSATHLNLGSLYVLLGQYSKAQEHYHRALLIQSELGEPDQLWRVLDGLRHVHAARNQLSLAVFFGKQAVNTIQAVRADILELEKSLQRSYLEDKIQVYRGLADLLIDSGRLWEAQQVLRMLKEEEYFDFVRGALPVTAASTQAFYSKGEQPWQHRYDQLIQNLAKLRAEYEELKQKARVNILTDSEKIRLEQLKEDRKQLRVAHREYLSELTENFANVEKDRLAEFPEKHLNSLKALQSALKTLGPDLILIHYFVTNEKLRIIVSVPDPLLAPIHRDVAINSNSLNRLIKEFRDSLQNPTRDPLPPAKRLYGHLIEPIVGILDAYNAKTLLVYLDDALRYVPLAALYDTRRDEYLAQRYAMARYTVGSDIHLKDEPRTNWRIAGLGVSEGFEDLNFSPLPAVVDELNAIVRESEQDSVGILPGKVYMDAAFTPDQLKTVLDPDCGASDCYQVIHLSTHFNFKPGTLTDSFLLLGRGTRLNLADFLSEEYDFSAVDLMTLSACETALSGDDAKGREVEGLGALAQNSGAKAVIATLWNVADRSTAIFMEQFYKHRQQQRRFKSEALRRTQEAFIKGAEMESAIAVSDAERGIRVYSEHEEGNYQPVPGAPYAHPFYWAPFVLMGNFL